MQTGFDRRANRSCPSIQQASIPVRGLDLQSMSGRPTVFDSQQGDDLENDKYKPRKREHNRRKSVNFLFRTKRSTWQLVGVLALFILTCLYYRKEYETQISLLNEQILLHELEFENSRPKAKYAIVTLETRHSTYWQQSLGNKFDYARRHGYLLSPNISNCLLVTSFILILNNSNTTTGDMFGPKYLLSLMQWRMTILSGCFGWTLIAYSPICR
jgi:hypothetical protein